MALGSRLPPSTPFLPQMPYGDLAADESLLCRTGPIFDDYTLDDDDFLPLPSRARATHSIAATTYRLEALRPREQGPAVAESAQELSNAEAGPSRTRTLFSESPPPCPDFSLDFGAGPSFPDENDQLQVLGEETFILEGKGVCEPDVRAVGDISRSSAWSAISSYSTSAKRRADDTSFSSSTRSISKRCEYSRGQRVGPCCGGN